MSVEEVRMVKVTWLDSWCGSDADFTLAETKDLEPQQVETLGFLLEENKKCVKIAMAHSPRNAHGCSSKSSEFYYVTVLPKGCVLQIRELKEAE